MSHYVSSSGPTMILGLTPLFNFGILLLGVLTSGAFLRMEYGQDFLKPFGLRGFLGPWGMDWLNDVGCSHEIGSSRPGGVRRARQSDNMLICVYYSSIHVLQA